MNGPPPGHAKDPADGPEGRLVALARAGDADSFGRLVAIYQDRVHGLALRITGDAGEAEDVAQDAFLRAWRALPRFRGEARFSTWLYRIVARRAFDALRALRARRARSVPLETVPEPPVPSTVAGPEARRLETLVRELPEIQRAALTLYL